MSNTLIFTLLSAMAVASPGPGVVMTLTNAIHQDGRRAFFGIVGIAIGSIVTAALSASAAGAALASSPVAFEGLRLVGAVYLIVLGWKAWRAAGTPAPAAQRGVTAKGLLAAAWQGVSLQFTNPKSLLFFLSVLPQFIDTAAPFAAQVAVLATIYASVVMAIHSAYAVLARRLQQRFATVGASACIRRGGAVCFVLFGVALLALR